jgi:hypothetical protein
MKKLLLFTLAFAFALAISPAAKADTFNITSDWQTGESVWGNLNTYTGNGTFVWNGSTLSLISFSFEETSAEVCGAANYAPPCVTIPPPCYLDCQC